MSAPLVTVDARSIRSGPEPIGTIGLPMRDQMSHETVVSLMGTRWPEPTDKLIFQGSVLTIQRNALVQRMRGDWIVMIDDDMVWEPDAISLLVDSHRELAEKGIEADILGGLCFRRGFPYQPTMYMRTGDGHGPYELLETWSREEPVVEVDGTGMAFALITRRCFERIVGEDMPPYEARADAGRHPDFFQWREAVGEDLRFCMDVRAAGGRIFVDTRIKTGHVTSILANERLYLNAMARRPMAEALARARVNDEMGLPTLWPDVAMARLDDD